MPDKRRTTPTEQPPGPARSLREELGLAVRRGDGDGTALDRSAAQLGADARRHGFSAIELLAELSAFDHDERDRQQLPDSGDVVLRVVRATIRGYWSAARAPLPTHG